MGSGNQQDNWGGANHFQRSSNYNNGSNFGYGGNQQRWNVARGGGFQYRARDNGAGVQARSGIDADLLHQTVQAVVAAVTAATKISEPTQNVPHVAANTTDILVGGADQHAVMPVAVSNAVPQQTQGVEDTQVAGAKGKDNEGQGPLKKKKEDKTGCFRCKQPGHYIDDCPTPFCDLCESIHHAAPACHLLQAPKPSAIIHGYANEALMFFELPCGAFKAKVENPKLAKVTVDGDAMTIPALIDQLKKFVPSDKFNWEVFHFNENIYRVKLPSKQEVQRLKNFGTYICTDRESCLTFDLWSSLEEPLYTLPEVWVLVSGLPNDIRSDYLSLWGVGTLFGKTLDVDMAYTRNNKVLRTKIGCLDRNLIPADSDVFIRRGFFKLSFEVEAANGSQEVNMAEANNDSTPRKSTSGLSQVGILASGSVAASGRVPVLAHAASPLVGARVEGLQPASGQQQPHAASGQQGVHAVREQQSLPLSAAPSSRACGRMGEQRASCAGAAGHSVTATHGRGDREAVGAGFSVAGEDLPAACVSLVPQKIHLAIDGGPGRGLVARGNHSPMIGSVASEMAVADSLEGSAMHVFSVANGMPNVAKNIDVSIAGSVLEPNLVSSLEQTKEGITDEVLLTTKEGLTNIGLQDSMGIASSTRTNAQPTMEEG
ncbi:hypothetical protein ACQ4PT_069695 [Festuca glaucescens]